MINAPYQKAGVVRETSPSTPVEVLMAFFQTTIPVAASTAHKLPPKSGA
jgi:hypothetical protein